MQTMTPASPDTRVGDWAIRTARRAFPPGCGRPRLAARPGTSPRPADGALSGVTPAQFPRPHKGLVTESQVIICMTKALGDIQFGRPRSVRRPEPLSSSGAGQRHWAAALTAVRHLGDTAKIQSRYIFDAVLRRFDAVLRRVLLPDNSAWPQKRRQSAHDRGWHTECTHTVTVNSSSGATDSQRQPAPYPQSSAWLAIAT
jgi:hypothetical protein